MKKLISVVFLVLPFFCGAHPQNGNNKSGIECYKCSSDQNSKCAINPAADLPKVFCKNPKDQCITAIVNGVTIRGCEKEANVPNKALSQKCDSKLCNIEIFPKDRHKCYQCSGKCCVTDFRKHLKPCVIYNENDSCVTVVEDEKNVVRKCASDPGFSPSKYAATCQGFACNNHSSTYTAECISCSQRNATSTSCVRPSSPVAPGNKCSLPYVKTCKESLPLNRPISCFTYKRSGRVVRGCAKKAGDFAKDTDYFSLCEGPLCNNECLPIKCVSCDSRVDPRCFDKTKELELKKCSGDIACFVGQTPDGEIIRGCGEKSKDTSQATPCSFDGCNNKDFPVPKRNECYKCNSKNLAECATKPSASLPHDRCKDPKDNCITAIVDGVTFRGCEKEVNVPNKTLSQKCNSKLCNIEIFPKDRLKCYQCKGNSCVTDFKEQLQPCVNYNKNDSCVTVAEDEKNVVRKCASDPGFTPPKYAAICQGSACNKHSATYTAECSSCSQTDATSTFCVRPSSPVALGNKCVLPQEKTCKDSLLLNRPISCFTYKKSGKVVRGCTKDAGDLAKDGENFSTCEGPLCNNECLPVKCVSCDSRVDPRCFDKTKELELKKCSSEMACFVGQTKDGEIIRGCGEKSKDTSQATPCSFDGCNNKDFPVPKRNECYKCNSKNLAECATKPSASLPHDRCKDPKDNCITAIVDGVTFRGCEKEVNVPNKALSQKCDSKLCNIEIFPKDRLKCYQCKGNSCVTDFKEQLQPCVNYNKNDSCVTVAEDEKNVVRKCASDPGFTPPKYAAICQGSACNKHSATYTAECSSCSQTNATSTFCVRPSSPVAPGNKCVLPQENTCKDSLLLNRPISCFTYKKSGKVVRGCTKDAGDLAKDGENFSTCEGPLCNNECLPVKCVSCDSRVDPRCFDKTKELELKKCSSEMACFVGQTPDGEIIRGCGEKSKDTSQTTPCSFDGCNNKDFPVPKKNECYKCNSKDLAECATKPSASLPHDRCKDQKDNCITAIVDGVTFRGCEKEVNVPNKTLSQKCDSKLCNIEIFPKDRLKCYQCQGNSCVTDFKEQLQPCVNYNKNDSCVTVAEDEKNVVRKCASDPGFTPPRYAAICQGSACNKHSATYTAECSFCSQTNATSTFCVRPSSPVAPGNKCALPQEKTCKDSLLLNRPISCFTYKKSGKVVRGCTKDAGDLAKDDENFSTCEGPLCNNECLPVKCVSCDSRVDPRCFDKTKELKLKNCSSEMACFVGQTPDGEIIRGCGEKSKDTSQTTPCNFDGCNNKDFPVPNRNECYKCNSKDLAECATKPSASLPQDRCKDPKDNCITAIVDGVTFRGCEKEVNVPIKALSQKCDSKLCNIEIFPKDRLKCYQCKGNSCVTDFKEQLQPCVNYNENDSCVTVAEDEKNVVRKCASDPGFTPPKYAVICQGSACNKHSATYTAECFSCSQTNATSTFCVRSSSPVAPGNKCVLPQEKTCKDSLLLNRPISCFTYKKSGKVVRGCTKDAGDLAKDGENFSTCEGPLCNNECLPVKCVSCDSRVDPRCFDKTKELELKKCSSEMACFVGQTPDGEIIRGCGEKSKNTSQTIPCYFDGCNNKDFPVPKRNECYKCNSKDLAECATKPSASLPHDRCKDSKDNCITAIVDGVTFRGCEKEVNVPNKALSQKCNSKLCNIEIFPKDRLKCYQCKGNSCVTDFKEQLQPCVNYNENDSCVTVAEDEKNVVRKCASDPGFKPPKYAEICQGSACNKHSATHTVECISCSETSNTTSCTRVPSSDASGKCKLPKVETCTETTLLNRPSCFTYKMSGRVVRGCTKDAGKLALDTKNFETCEGQWCNNECLPIKCVSCDSRVTPECAKDANNLEPQLCSNETTCFIGQTSEGAIIRGCGSESKEAVQISSCSTDGCNKVNKVFPPTTKRLECFKCVSTNLTECAKNPSPSLPRDYCKDANDQCVTAVVDGVTYRGCEKELNVPANSISGTCNTNLCNVEQFKILHSGKEKAANNNFNNNNYSNNYNNNNNSNNNNNNNIFVQIINFNFGKNNNSSNKVLEKLNTATLR